MAIHEIDLSDYKAKVNGEQYLVLGTWDSYGIEQLQINPGPEWEGLVIKAVFVTPAGPTPVVVPESGLIDVPPEATAHMLPIEAPGMIVFSGVTEGVQRITCNLLYIVRNHAPIDGTVPTPTPDEWAQFVAMVQQYARQASQSATESSASAAASKNSELQAASSATESESSAGAAAQSAAQAEISANLAQQGAANAGWFNVEGADGILYFIRSDNAPDDFVLQDNGEGVLEAVYG